MYFYMDELQFTAKIYKSGKSHVITIPGADIRHKRLKPGKSYRFSVNTQPVEHQGTIDGSKDKIKYLENELPI